MDRIESIQPGMVETMTRTITDTDVRAFAELSGDHNPVHLDDAYAATTPFGRRIAHGVMSAGFFSALFASRLPGPGAVYLSQSMSFRRPIYVGDTIEVSIEVKAVDPRRRRVQFGTTCRVGGKVAVSGEAEILIPAPPA